MKEKIINGLLCFLLPALLLSCSVPENSLFTMLSRSTEDPVNAVPVVDCFSTLGAVKLSWEKDGNCDYYRLYRAENEDTEEKLVFKKIYEGTDCSFCDTDVLVNSLYRYRLDKVRGLKTFKGNCFALAVGVPIPIEAVNDKSCKENAFELDYKCNSCCYYYVFDGDTELKNDDWYKVRIPPMKKAEIMIDGVSDEFFQYIKPGIAASTKLKNKGVIYLENNSYQEKYLYFVIQANPEKFANGLTGGTIKSYRLELVKISAQ